MKTAFHAIDFAKADESAYEGFAAALKEKDVSVLGECGVPYAQKVHG